MAQHAVIVFRIEVLYKSFSVRIAAVIKGGIMLQKFGIVLFTLTLVVTLSACGGKEEADTEATEAPVEESAPRVVPGEMVFIPGGDFILGTEDEGHPTANYPARTMNLPAFWIDKYEVTNNEFMDFSHQRELCGRRGQRGQGLAHLLFAG